MVTCAECAHCFNIIRPTPETGHDHRHNSCKVISGFTGDTDVVDFGPKYEPRRCTFKHSRISKQIDTHKMMRDGEAM